MFFGIRKTPGFSGARLNQNSREMDDQREEEKGKEREELIPGLLIW